MKTKQILLIAAVSISAIFLLSSFLMQQAEGTKYLTVKTIEFHSGAYDSKITVVDENGHIEEFELDKLRSDNLGSNTKKINDVLNNVSKKGYTLVNSTSAGFGEDGLLNTFVFSKK